MALLIETCPGPPLRSSRLREPLVQSGGAPAHRILRAVNEHAKEQATVNRFAVLAKPRLTTLLRLRSVRHLYDPTPGVLNSTFLDGGKSVTLNKLKRASQPYRDIERFLSAEKVIQYIIDPGLLPVVTALSKDIAGKQLLVTRRVGPLDDDKGVIAHLDGFGVRIMMHFDEAAGETLVVWSCLYGVL